jgi:two-component system NtrC family response regulator
LNKFKIIIIDDEEAQRDSIKGFLNKKGFEATAFSSCDEGMEYLKHNLVDLVVTDFKMPEKTGADVLNETHQLNPLIPVVVMTAYGSIDVAVNLMKSGAFDYIQKPIELEELLQIIERAKERSFLMSENRLLKKELEEKYSFSSIIASSSEMENVINTAGRVAKSKASILIRGESGTGKELIAKAIHFASERSDKPFVVVNCAAMPETLFESELFGHEKGAFTGADRQRIGKFEQANGGTLFIDEVGDIPLAVQVKLLRAVQFGEIQRLGGNKTFTVDVRIITATNRNLEELIKESRFREDLFYRFNVVAIQLPPLRNRRTEIPMLVNHFIEKYSNINNKAISSISKEALDALMRYDYPGNVRELENIVQRAVVLTRGDVITTADLPPIVRQPIFSESSIEDECGDIEIGDLNQKVEALESMMLKKALAHTNGNQSKAAALLNITERTLRYKIMKYGIK